MLGALIFAYLASSSTRDWSVHGCCSSGCSPTFSTRTCSRTQSSPWCSPSAWGWPRTAGSRLTTRSARPSTPPSRAAPEVVLRLEVQCRRHQPVRRPVQGGVQPAPGSPGKRSLRPVGFQRAARNGCPDPKASQVRPCNSSAEFAAGLVDLLLERAADSDVHCDPGHMRGNTCPRLQQQVHKQGACVSRSTSGSRHVMPRYIRCPSQRAPAAGSIWAGDHAVSCSWPHRSNFVRKV